MKKLFILAALAIVVISVSKAQQLPLYSQYMMNDFLMNPAIAGSVEYTPIRLTARTQWVGINDAPKTFALSGHTLFSNKKVGVGGYVFTDMFGPIARTGLQGSFAYHLPVSSEAKVSLGLSISAFQFRLDEKKLTLIEDNDAAISGSTESRFMPDAIFGAYFYSNTYFVGISAAQLFQFKVKLIDNPSGESENKMVRHYFGTAGYRFKIGKDFMVEPSILVKATETAPIQLDFNAKAVYLKNYWLAVSYRTKDAIIGMLGIKIDKYYLGYSFDYTLSKIVNYSSGSHEIMIGVNIGEGASQGSRLL